MRHILFAFAFALTLSPTIAGAQYLQQSAGFGSGGYGVGQSFAPVGGLGTCGVGAALDTVGYGTCGNVGQAVVVPQQAIVQQEYIQQTPVVVQQAPVVVQRAVPVYINRGFGVGGYGINRGFGLGSGVGYGLNSGYGLGLNQNVGLGLAGPRRFRGVQRFHQGPRGFRGRQRIRGRS